MALPEEMPNMFVIKHKTALPSRAHWNSLSLYEINILLYVKITLCVGLYKE